MQNQNREAELTAGENAVHVDSFGHIIPGVFQPGRYAKRMARLRYIIYAVGFALCSCQSADPPNAGSTPTAPETVRVSDEYSRVEVVSYEAFEWPVSHHCMAMVTLKSGRKFPMLCRRQSASIYPIPQSVFATDDPTRFGIMCEPLIANGVSTHALMRISVDVDEQGLSNGNRKVPKIFPVPELIRCFFHVQE